MKTKNTQFFMNLFFLIGCMVILTTSCKRDDETNPEEILSGMIPDEIQVEIFDNPSEGQGSASPGTSEQPDTPRGTTSGDEVGLFEIEFRSSTNSDHNAFYSAIQDLPDTVNLEPDDYKVFVQNRDFPNAAFSWPHYCGESEIISLDRGQFLPISVSAKPCNSRLRFIYTDALSNLFSNYSALVESDNGENLFFEKSEERLGYFSSNHSLTATVNLERISNDGSLVSKTVTGVLENIEAGKSYTVRVNADLASGGFFMEVSVDSEWTEVDINIGDPEEATKLVANSWIDIDVNNVINSYDCPDATCINLRIQTNKPQQATHNVYLSDDKNTKGQIIESNIRGTFIHQRFFLNTVNGRSVHPDELLYLTVESTFDSGEEVSNRIALYIPPEPLESSASFMSIDIEQTRPPLIVSNAEDTDWFFDNGDFKLPISRLSSAPNDIRYHVFGDTRGSQLINFGDALTTEVPYEYASGGGIQRLWLSGKHQNFAPTEYSDNYYVIIMGELKEEHVTVRSGDEGIEISTRNYGFIGVAMTSVWRTDTPEFTDSYVDQVSGFVSNLTETIIDRSPEIPRGKTVYYHVQMSSSSSSNSVKTNVITIPYTRTY